MAICLACEKKKPDHEIRKGYCKQCRKTFGRINAEYLQKQFSR